MKELYEKISLYGAGNMTLAELLSVVVDSKEMGERIAKENNLKDLARCHIPRLRMVEGMGLAKAAKIAAAAELGRRIEHIKSDDISHITCDGEAVAVLRPLFANIKHEECWVIFMTSSSMILDKMRVSQGGLQQTVIDCRLIIKRALDLLATRILLAHNHPSEVAVPSQEDRDMTARLNNAAQLFNIELLDHIILTSADFYSFRAHGLL